MDTTSAQQDNLHKIVILNPKGGCGKTTLATNLASYYAMRGPPPTLVDCDPGGYCMRWVDKRPAERPRVYGFPVRDRCAHTGQPLPAWQGSRELIVDLPAAMTTNQLFHEIYDAGSVLIPIVPSEIDVHSAAQFIADLLLVAQFDRRSRNLAIVANRTRHYTRSYRMLMRFLTSLRIPIAAQLRDSQNYTQAAALGIGICELPVYRAGKDIEQVIGLVRWLDNWRVRRFGSLLANRYERSREPEVIGAELAADLTHRPA